MVRKTPIKGREVPKEVVEYMENAIYDAELEMEKAPDSGGALEAKQDIKFLESLQDGITKYGSLTGKQEAAVRRMMRRNKDAILPPVGERLIFQGEIASVRAYEVDDRGPTGGRVLLFSFTLFNHLDIEVNFSIRENSKMYNAIDLNWDYESGQYRIYEYPEALRIKGTVKRTRPGRIWLSRVVLPKKK